MALVIALKDKNPSVVLKATNILMKHGIKDARVALALVNVLKDPDILFPDQIIKAFLANDPIKIDVYLALIEGMKGDSRFSKFAQEIFESQGEIIPPGLRSDLVADLAANSYREKQFQVDVIKAMSGLFSKCRENNYQIAARLGYFEADIFNSVFLSRYLENKNNDGHTLLHVAAQGQSKAMVELLLQKGADILARDSAGRTAIELAFEPEIIELLGSAAKYFYLSDHKAYLYEPANMKAMSLSLLYTHLEAHEDETAIALGISKPKHVRAVLDELTLKNLQGIATKKIIRLLEDYVLPEVYDPNTEANIMDAIRGL